jgi:iron-sulfur cluster repair protein YtfE (RIC family)|tara:strand:- start:974 stop:1405 length:432 start_codon:yes stop_codon:yes gene_type:complete
MEEVSLLMVQEHKRVKEVLDEFEKELDENFEKCREIFSKFKWGLEKHFFIEEKVIFVISQKIRNEEVSDIFNLMQEHGEIIEVIKGIEDKLSENIKPNLDELKDLLIKHCMSEEEVFYDKLDQTLSPELKKEISEKINEVIRG